MGRVVAVANQKGGVGKTTTAVNLAAALAMAEQPTLLIDADPQANTTRALGFGEEAGRPSLYEAIIEDRGLDQVTLSVSELPMLGLVPSDQNLIGAEIELVNAEEREFRLKRLIDEVRSRYAHIFIDCPPSLGLITLNALTAADGVLIPVQSEYLALEGISQLVDTIRRVQASLNPELILQGVLMTMFDERTNLSRQVAAEVREFFGDRVYQTMIPRNIRLGEAPSYGIPIFLYDIRSKGAEAYLQLARELLTHEEESVGERAT